ncbi:MAG: inorganic diphosphatase [bacterium]
MSIKNLKIGENFPKELNVVIEIPKGSQNKYEYDEEMDIIKLDRVLHSPMFYPTDYGFIPETRSEDGDHLDALVVGSTSFFVGTVVKIRPIALFNMIDQGEKDTKIIGVAVGDPRFAHIKSKDDLPEHLYKEISHFFSEYKRLENKKVEVEGWHDKKEAWDEIKKAFDKYKEEILEKNK